MIQIFLNMAGEKQLVGRLLKQSKGTFFQYSPEFVETGLPLSPFHLPLANKVYEAPKEPFGGLHGLFADSLPDGWGLLLMDRHLRQQGINIKDITPLDRLLYIGSTAMGALSYEPDHSAPSSCGTMDLLALSQEAAKVFAGKTEDILPALIQAGSSPGGARPKVLVGIKGKHIISGERDLPTGYQAWLIKFHTSPDKGSDEGLIEEAYARMLRLANIPMSPTQLINVNDRQYFATQRFDRSNGQRLHVHSLAGLAHANFRLPDFDYEKLFRITLMLTKNTLDVAQAYRQMVFNVLANNQDDHTKNFSFIMNAGGEWRLSPAYDVTFNQTSGNEQTMAVRGYGKNIPKSVFYELGRLCDLDERAVKGVFAETFEALSHWSTLAGELGLADYHRQEIQGAFNRLFETYRGMG